MGVAACAIIRAHVDTAGRLPDRPRIVAAVAGCLAAHGGNIVDSDQHTDPDDLTFHQRLRFQLPEASAAAFEAALALLARATWAPVPGSDDPAARRRMAIFVSKLDHCLYDLLLRQRPGELPCGVAAGVSNHPDLAPVAATSGCPSGSCPSPPPRDAEHDAAVIALLDEHAIDLVVLARYMQVLSASSAPAAGTDHQHPPLVPARVQGRAGRTTRPTSAA